MSKTAVTTAIMAEVDRRVDAAATGKPWLTEAKYGGMSLGSAEKSWRAAEKWRVESELESSCLAIDQNEIPLPRSLAEYGLSPDAIPEVLLEGGTSQLAQRQITFTPLSGIILSTAARYVVKGLIPNAGLVVVWGPPKCGKSFFVFDMVAHVAAGWPYRDRKVKQSPVVYFALEGQEGFEARVEAFRRLHSISDIPFYLSTDRVVLPDDGKAIVGSIRAQFPLLKPGIVVLDTLNRSIVGSENDPSDMGLYVRAADMIRQAFCCVVIIIHHCGVEGTRPRGHTSLTGAADAQIAVKRNPAGTIVASLEFLKDGPAGAEVVSSLEQVMVGTDDDGDPITSCIIRPSEPSVIKTKTKVTGFAGQVLRALCEMIAKDGVVPPTNSQIPPDTKTISEKAWREHCYAQIFNGDTKPGTRQRTFHRASTKLLELHRIGKWEDHVWLT